MRSLRGEELLGRENRVADALWLAVEARLSRPTEALERKMAAPEIRFSEVS
jgi:hypothetical protein